MIEDKIKKYRQDIVLAKTLAENKFADRDYYNDIPARLEKILKFYEDLKVWKELVKIKD